MSAAPVRMRSRQGIAAALERAAGALREPAALNFAIRRVTLLGVTHGCKTAEM